MPASATKKAAKKAPKKAAKKAPKHDKKHHEGKDVRRAYEHMGRLEALQSGLSSPVVAQIHTLSEMARRSLQKGDSKSSADLLRAGEHLAFASLSASTKESVSDELRSALTAQYEHLLEKAAEHWDEHEEEPAAAITTLYEKSLADAESAFGKGAYRKALELVRAAEALSHVETDGSPALDVGSKPSKKKLKA